MLELIAIFIARRYFGLSDDIQLIMIVPCKQYLTIPKSLYVSEVSIGRVFL